MKGIWGEFRRSWRDFGRFWKAWLLFCIFWYGPWIVANWVLPLYGFSEEMRLMVMVVGCNLAFSGTLIAYFLGVGVPKCPLCGRPLERREEGSVVSYHCPVHGNVRGAIREG